MLMVFLVVHCVMSMFVTCIGRLCVSHRLPQALLRVANDPRNAIHFEDVQRALVSDCLITTILSPAKPSVFFSLSIYPKHLSAV